VSTGILADPGTVVSVADGGRTRCGRGRGRREVGRCGPLEGCRGEQDSECHRSRGEAKAMVRRASNSALWGSPRSAQTAPIGIFLGADSSRRPRAVFVQKLLLCAVELPPLWIDRARRTPQCAQDRDRGTRVRPPQGRGYPPVRARRHHHLSPRHRAPGLRTGDGSTCSTPATCTPGRSAGKS